MDFKKERRNELLKLFLILGLGSTLFTFMIFKLVDLIFKFFKL